MKTNIITLIVAVIIALVTGQTVLAYDAPVDTTTTTLLPPGYGPTTTTTEPDDDDSVVTTTTTETTTTVPDPTTTTVDVAPPPTVEPTTTVVEPLVIPGPQITFEGDCDAWPRIIFPEFTGGSYYRSDGLPFPAGREFRVEWGVTYIFNWYPDSGTVPYGTVTQWVIGPYSEPNCPTTPMRGTRVQLTPLPTTIPPAADTPATTAISPTQIQLPETGGSVNSALIGIISMLLGGVLLLIARRRPVVN